MAELRWQKDGDDGAFSRVVAFGVRDDKDREVGVQFSIYKSYPEGGLLLRTWSMRNSRRFGAIPRGTVVESLDLGKALAEKKLKASRQRAMRKWKS